MKKHDRDKSNDLRPYSNEILLSKVTKGNLIDKKIVAYAITKIRKYKDGELKGRLVAEVSSNELIKKLHLSSNYYTKFKQFSAMADYAFNHRVYISKSNGDMEAFCIVNNISYAGGTFRFIFDVALEKYLYDLDGNFTLIPIETLMSFKSINTYRLYEILKTDGYKILAKEGAHYDVVYNLDELKFMIGLVDLNDAEKSRLSKGVTSYTDFLAAMPNPPYRTWQNFKLRVLETAKKEMEESELSDIRFEYSPIKNGPGGKVTDVEFHIYAKYNNNMNSCDLRNIVKRNTESINVADAISVEHIDKVLSHKKVVVKRDQARRLLILAKDDVDRVIRVMDALAEEENISNPIGWMTTAIKENWEFDGENRRVKRNINFNNNFNQREYDFEELEKALLNKQNQRNKEKDNLDPLSGCKIDSIDQEFEQHLKNKYGMSFEQYSALPDIAKNSIFDELKKMKD